MRGCRFVVLSLCMLFIWSAAGFAAPKVCVVIAVDTEADQTHSGPGPGGEPPLRTVEHPTLYLNTFSREAGSVSNIMDLDFRISHTDSNDNPFKVSWFMEMDKFYSESLLESGESFGYVGIYNVLRENWAAEIAQYGDEYAYHHHFMRWNGTNYWDQVTSLTSPPYVHHEDAVNHMILDGGFFPSSWRSGWVWEDNDLSAFLEEYIPFDYTNDNTFSYWTGAPSSWVPYHPDPGDYKTPGDMDRWVARTLSDPAYWTQGNVDSAFSEAQAADGTVIFAFSFHNRDDMAACIDQIHMLLLDAESRFGVPFEYTTAKEAVQSLEGFTDTTPPVLHIAPAGDTYIITSDEPLWNDNPYVTVRYDDGTLAHLEAEKSGENTWVVTVSGIREIGVGASDMFGNTAVEVIPEPASLSLILISVAGIAAGAFRRLRALKN